MLVTTFLHFIINCSSDMQITTGIFNKIIQLGVAQDYFTKLLVMQRRRILDRHRYLYIFWHSRLSNRISVAVDTCLVRANIFEFVNVGARRTAQTPRPHYHYSRYHFNVVRSCLCTYQGSQIDLRVLQQQAGVQPTSRHRVMVDSYTDKQKSQLRLIKYNIFVFLVNLSINLYNK